MQDRLQEALDAYRPMCAECDLAMSKHQSYRRSIIHQGRRTEAFGSEVSMLWVWTDEQWDGSSGRREAESLLKKTREKAIALAAMGLSCAQVGKLFGFAKSTLCKWIRGERLRNGDMGGEVLEMDGLWTPTREGAVEMKVIRDDLGNVMATFGS